MNGEPSTCLCGLEACPICQGVVLASLEELSLPIEDGEILVEDEYFRSPVFLTDVIGRSAKINQGA